MGGDDNGWGKWDGAASPIGAPIYGAPARDNNNEHWTHFDNSVNAVSFGFVATAILISMFVVMAVFERFLRPNSAEESPAPPSDGRNPAGDIESQIAFSSKLRHPTPKIDPSSGQEFPVLMPGEHMPTFIAHFAPVPSTPTLHCDILN